MFDQKLFDCYFLGANTAMGFCSKFADNFDNTSWRAFIIKGGPGTGKSTLLKKVAMHYREQGETVLICPCSSDPESLDAVLVPDLKVILLDGTAPHVVEPKYPGVCEVIINLGDAFNLSKFCGNEAKIIELCNKNSALHGAASRYVSAAGKLIVNSFLTAMEYVNVKKAEGYAELLSKKYITYTEKTTDKVWERFLLSPSNGRLICFNNTVNNRKTVITISDEFFAVSSVIMQRLLFNARKSGHECVAVLNPFIEGVIDAVIIPSLDIAFCVKNRFYEVSPTLNTLHSERFCFVAGYKKHKNKLKFNKNTADMLLLEAANTIAKAKEVHDDIERFYINAMNYEKLNEMTDSFINSL